MLQDVRVREALGLAFDYEWMNRQMFYNAYQRVSTACSATPNVPASGVPSAQELALLEPWRGKVPDAVFGPMTVPPRTDGDSSLRGNLRKAKALLNAGRLGRAGTAAAQCQGRGVCASSTWTAMRRARAW